MGKQVSERYIDPVVKKLDDDPLSDSIETHPAYAQIAASRVSGGALLYGSEFQHQHFMTIKIARSERHRGLSRDWHFARDEMIEVALSEAQWATFVSTPNVGGGVPCTLLHVDRVDVPQIASKPERRTQFADELKARLKIVEDELKELRKKLGDSKLSEKAKTDLVRNVDAAMRNLTPNLSFVAKSFGEHMEDVTESAKIEVAAYVENAINRAGVAALSGAPPIALIDSKPKKGGAE